MESMSVVAVALGCFFCRDTSGFFLQASVHNALRSPLEQLWSGTSCAGETDVSSPARQRRRQDRKDLDSWELSIDQRTSRQWRRGEYIYHTKVAEGRYGQDLIETIQHSLWIGLRENLTEKAIWIQSSFQRCSLWRNGQAGQPSPSIQHWPVVPTRCQQKNTASTAVASSALRDSV